MKLLLDTIWIEYVLIQKYLAHLDKVEKNCLQMGVFTLALELVCSTFLMGIDHLCSFGFRCWFRYIPHSNGLHMFEQLQLCIKLNFISNSNVASNSNFASNSTFVCNLNSATNMIPKYKHHYYNL